MIIDQRFVFLFIKCIYLSENAGFYHNAHVFGGLRKMMNQQYSRVVVPTFATHFSTDICAIYAPQEKCHSFVDLMQHHEIRISTMNCLKRQFKFNKSKFHDFISNEWEEEYHTRLNESREHMTFPKPRMDIGSFALIRTIMSIRWNLCGNAYQSHLKILSPNWLNWLLTIWPDSQAKNMIANDHKMRHNGRNNSAGSELPIDYKRMDSNFFEQLTDSNELLN